MYDQQLDTIPSHGEVHGAIKGEAGRARERDALLSQQAPSTPVAPSVPPISQKFTSDSPVSVPQAPPAPPLSAPYSPSPTSYNCRRMSAWADVCSYKDICYDGRAFYFLAPGGCMAGSVATCQENYGDSDLREGLIFPSNYIKPAEQTYFPFNGGACRFLVNHLNTSMLPSINPNISVSSVGGCSVLRVSMLASLLFGCDALCSHT